MGHSRPLFFFFFVFSIKLIVNVQCFFGRWLVLNCRTLVAEATAPQLSHNHCLRIVCNNLSAQILPSYRAPCVWVIIGKTFPICHSISLSWHPLCLCLCLMSVGYHLDMKYELETNESIVLVISSFAAWTCVTTSAAVPVIIIAQPSWSQTLITSALMMARFDVAWWRFDPTLSLYFV